MHIAIARTDLEIERCFSVMAELRPHLKPSDFLPRVRAQETQGYRLAYGIAQNTVCVVAGFRLLENLAVGRFLYVDDLVSAARFRSQGHGSQMLTWLKTTAQKESGIALHLDSGVQRLDAHRFYEREGMKIVWYHFASPIPIPPPLSP